MPQKETIFILFRQPQDHFTEHTPHQILLSTQRPPEPPQLSKVIYKAGCCDYNEFYIGKIKRRLHERKIEHFKALAKSDHSSAIADHVKITGRNIKWDHFDIIASGKTDLHCKIKDNLFI